MNDFDFQLKYVAQQAQRLMAMQDGSPASPTYGCFHYAYWRDKTSEFPDARFQEAGATLGLLSHPAIYEQAEVSISREVLRERFLAGLKNWRSQQHRDGSFDEWYKHEHGFAATVFSMIAYGLALHELGISSTQPEFKIYQEVATRAGRWLRTHEDLVKTNHEMAGAAALAIAGKVLSQPEMLAEASKKHRLALRCQTSEGWFNEIAGMDLGYCFVLLDYAMLYRRFSGDSSGLESMKKLFKFVLPFIQPDLTIPAEAGLCLNPYVSRVGTLLLAKEMSEADAFVNSMTKSTAGYPGIEPYLSDDLRLCRWSHLPLMAKILLQERNSHTDQILGSVAPSGLTRVSDANIYSFRAGDTLSVFLPAGGGVVKATTPRERFEDPGYIYWSDQGAHTSVGYDRSRKVEETSSGTFQMKLPFSPAVFFFPSFLSRLVLRLAGSIPGMYYWLRKGIDLYRKMNKTAINQSAAPVSSAQAHLVLTRTVTLQPDQVVITDSFDSKSKLDVSRIESLARLNGALLPVDLKPGAKNLVITKTVTLSQNKITGVTIQCAE